ncbi:MAG TPA: methyltransferase, partial [Planctomycetota bacterium]|nr:methyltransferase [Planctomycetota bacterium]
PRFQDGSLRGVLVRATGTGALGVVLLSATEFLPRERAVAEAIGALGAAAVWVNWLPTPKAHAGTLPTRVDAFDAAQLLGPHTRGVYGEDRLIEELHGIRYRVSPASFFQTSRFGAEQLVATVDRLAGPLEGHTVIDGYCGSGLLSLALARRAAAVVGVEDDEEAVADAERAARDNGLANVRFVAGAAQRILRTLAAERPHLVVLDPPRAGCHVGVLDAVAHDLRPDEVLYVACDVQSLARDAAELERLEYAVHEVQPIDMFPWTHHVETVARFVRNPQLRTGRKRFSRAAGERLLAKARAQPRTAP